VLRFFKDREEKSDLRRSGKVFHKNYDYFLFSFENMMFLFLYMTFARILLILNFF